MLPRGCLLHRICWSRRLRPTCLPRRDAAPEELRPRGPEQRARVEALKEEARAETVAYTLKELRQHRSLTQTELARRLERAQASVSAMETAADNLVSTLRMAVEGMGGHLEVTAVFDNERIPLTTNTRRAHQESEEMPGSLFAAMLSHLPVGPKYAEVNLPGYCAGSDP